MAKSLCNFSCTLQPVGWPVLFLTVCFDRVPCDCCVSPQLIHAPSPDYSDVSKTFLSSDQAIRTFRVCQVVQFSVH
ncbi:hypothetical protein BYT27DRAFT_7193084 [Phlegmacium glaucopus]|nr:hypothetical protein BYT27DRAFT_7193084 [Phlegmacium glaucopus]